MKMLKETFYFVINVIMQAQRDEFHAMFICPFLFIAVFKNSIQSNVIIINLC